MASSAGAPGPQLSQSDKNCTYLISTEKSASVQQEDICKELENPDVAVKAKALKNAITGLLAGETMPRVLMTVIRSVFFIPLFFIFYFFTSQTGALYPEHKGGNPLSSWIQFYSILRSFFSLCCVENVNTLSECYYLLPTTRWI